MKHVFMILTLLLCSAFAQNFSAQDFVGTFRDEGGDIHTIEQLSDGTLVGHFTTLQGLNSVPLQFMDGQAWGLFQLTEETPTLYLTLTPLGATQLQLTLVPIDLLGQPLDGQAPIMVLTRETTKNPLATQTPSATQNPLTNAPVASSSIQGVVLEPNQTYTSDTRLTSPATGISLAVPAGFTALYQITDTGQALTFKGSQNDGFVALGFSKADMNVLVGQGLSQFGNLETVQVGAPQITADSYRASYQANSNGAVIVIHIAIRQGSAGNALLLVGFAYAGQDTSLIQGMDNTLASLSFGAAQPNVAFSLGGLDLTADGGNSESNPNGDSHLSSIKKEGYTFCSDGRYGYSLQDTTMFSTTLPGGDFSDLSTEDSDQHQGSYQLGAGLLGEPMLMLQASDGRAFMFNLGQSATGVVIGGGEFTVSVSSQCQ